MSIWHVITGLRWKLHSFRVTTPRACHIYMRIIYSICDVAVAVDVVQSNATSNEALTPTRLLNCWAPCGIFDCRVAAVSCVNAEALIAQQQACTRMILNKLNWANNFFTVRNLYQYIHKTESFILSPWLSPSAAALPWFAVATAS